MVYSLEMLQKKLNEWKLGGIKYNMWLVAQVVTSTWKKNFNFVQQGLNQL